MYGKGVGVVSNTGNSWSFATSDVVTMEFKHALAWVNFTVNADAATSGNITVNSITLNGASYHGTYTIAHEKFNQTTGQDFGTGTWTNYTYTLPATAPNVVVPKFTTPLTVTQWSESAANRAANTIGEGLLVVPNGGFTSFTVNYTFNGNTFDYTFTPASVSLAQNTKYYYDITFKLHEILVNPTVAGWTDGGSPDVDIP